MRPEPFTITVWTETGGATFPGVVESVVIVERLTVSYGSTVVLDGIDTALSRGAVLSLVGENGAGKSTLLRCVTGLLGEWF